VNVVIAVYLFGLQMIWLSRWRFARPGGGSRAHVAVRAPCWRFAQVCLCRRLAFKTRSQFSTPAFVGASWSTLHLANIRSNIVLFVASRQFLFDGPVSTNLLLMDHFPCFPAFAARVPLGER